MSSGVPIIMISSGESKKIVNESECGITVNPGDLKGVSDSISRLIFDKDLREKMGSNGRKYVKTHFRRSIINKEFLEYLEKNDN